LTFGFWLLPFDLRPSPLLTSSIVCHPVAVIEATSPGDDPYTAKAQAREYAESIDAPFVFLSNGELTYFWDYKYADAELVASSTRRDLERLRYRLGLPDVWLVALISERAMDTDRLLQVLEMARETIPQRHYAVLPVRHEAMDWNLPTAFAAYPRIEARGDDLVVIRPDSPYHLPFCRWLRPAR
jgi:hypothetical protein